MTKTVTLPIWLLVLILLFAGVTFASHFLFPSVRWFFRKRAERVIANINKRLKRPIEPFKLAHRYDIIQRLIYDPEIGRAVAEHAAEENIPENVAFEQAKRYAREIVPSFSATVYFAIAGRFAHWLSQTMFRIRVGTLHRGELDAVDPDASIVFVINHKSNMDYVLVTYLISRASTISYAAGEWARVWPLSWLVRSMGAFFIRRRSEGLLYRRVLARYVQMATQAGVAQAVFPEGGLSLDGRVAEPRMGILNYIIQSWTPEGRDVVFVPVAINYDRVLEDGFLIAASKAGKRKFKVPMTRLLSIVAGHIWLRMTRRFKPFGTATVGFGEPLRLADYIEAYSFLNCVRA